MPASGKGVPGRRPSGGLITGQKRASRSGAPPVRRGKPWWPPSRVRRRPNPQLRRRRSPRRPSRWLPPALARTADPPTRQGSSARIATPIVEGPRDAHRGLQHPYLLVHRPRNGRGGGARGDRTHNAPAATSHGHRRRRRDPPRHGNRSGRQHGGHHGAAEDGGGTQRHQGGSPHPPRVPTPAMSTELLIFLSVLEIVALVAVLAVFLVLIAARLRSVDGNLDVLVKGL